MKRASFLPPGVMKELRVLLPAWLAVIALIIVAVPEPVGGAGAWILYAFGATALGAVSIGHEYTHRTLGMLLSLPASRRGLFATKLAVLLPMLLTVAAAANAFLFASDRPGKFQFGAWALVLPVLCGFFVTPWLTMLCRNALAGMVFSVALPGLLWGTLLTAAERVLGTEAVAGRELPMLWWTTLALSAVGAVAGWRTFTRLEAIDGRGQDIGLPRWLRRWTLETSVAAASATRRHRVWLLVKKEIRLQQMTLVVAGLFLIGWLVVIARGGSAPPWSDRLLLMTSFYALMVSLLIGSLAVAEERHLGTLEWHVLLPMAASIQWLTKVGVALALALVVAFGLSALMTSFNPAMDARNRVALAVPIMLLTMASLYVSSIARSAIWALLASVLVIIGAAVFGELTVVYWVSAVFRQVHRAFGTDGRHRLPPVRGDEPFLTALAALAAVGLVVLVLRFALVNYRSAERGATRVGKQVAWMAGYVVAAVASLGVVTVLFRLFAM